MYSKTKICNLALGILLLNRQFPDIDTATANEAKVLLQNWDIALNAVLVDLDLDSTSQEVNLSLIQENPVHGWRFAYLYPANCAFFRRIKSCAKTDNKYTFHEKEVKLFNGQKVIFANHCDAIAEYIPNDFPLNTLLPMAGMAIAQRLAILSSALIVGKGANALRQSITQQYNMTKAEAQAQDQRENFNFLDEHTNSEFVAERTS